MNSAFLQIVKKWYRMFRGTSILHKEQGKGKYYSKGLIKGYYSDLRHKVQGHVDKDGIPYNITNYGEHIYFCITIFQYGLGSYDLYLETHNTMYLEKLKKIAEWAIKNQNPSGGWEAFAFSSEFHLYSSMAQSEGASLLLRAFQEFESEEYLAAAKKAIDFMLAPVEEGGTAEYKNNALALKEFTDKPLILNGWIFSIWGLYELTLVVADKYYQIQLLKTLDSLEKLIPSFDNKYWSNYDLGKNITSPFYHNLHIAQLEVMYELFSREIFKIYAEIWRKYYFKKSNRYRAIIKKGFQKLKSLNNSVVLVE